MGPGVTVSAAARNRPPGGACRIDEETPEGHVVECAVGTGGRRRVEAFLVDTETFDEARTLQ